MQISHFPCDPRESHQPSVMGWGCGGMEQPALLSASGWEQATSVFLPHWREIPFCLLWLGILPGIFPPCLVGAWLGQRP